MGEGRGRGDSGHVFQGAVGIFNYFKPSIWRVNTAKLLVYLLIAPLFVFIQGVVGPVEKANAVSNLYYENFESVSTTSPYSGSSIFASYSNSNVSAAGSGSGSAGGFAGQGRYLLFNENGAPRSGTTSNLDLSNASQVIFKMIRGNSANGGEQPDAGEEVAFRYSTNSGSTWTNITSQISSSSASNTTWTTYTYDVPVGAKTSSTKLQWYQSTHSGSCCDWWGFDEITITQNGVSITTPASQSGTTGSNFTLNLSGSGATGSSPAYSVSSGSLPIGLTLNTSTGAISGVPKFAGTFTAAFTYSDGGTGSSGTTSTTSNVTFTISGSSGLSLLIRGNDGAATADSIYFGNNSLTAGTICFSDVKSTMDLTYGGGSSPGGTCGTGNLTVYARGSVTAPVTGLVTFCSYNDDGMRVVVNGLSLIDDTTDHGVTSPCNYSSSMYMYSGTQYPIEMWGHNGGGPGQMTLKWSYSGQSTIVVPNSNLSTTFPSIVAPTVTNVTSSTSDGNYYLGNTISIQVTFTDNVTVTGTPTLQLETGATDTSATYSSGSGTNVLTFTYTVASTDVSSDLNYKATNSLSGTIKSPGGVDANLTLPGLTASGSLATNKAFVIDGASPTISGINSSTSNGTYKVGDTVSIQVTFSSVVNVVTSGGTPTITLETGSTDRTATYASGSGSTVLTFTYTVQSGDITTDLDYTSTSALTLNGGTIKNAGGANASLTLPSPASAGSLGANKALIVDGVGPTISSSSPSDNGTGFLANANISVTFNEAISFGSGNIKLYKSDGTLIETYNVASSSAVSISSSTLTINPSSDLSSNTSYYLNFDSTAIKDAQNNYFAGISDSTTLNFTTYVTPVPSISAQPGNYSKTLGQSVTFTASATSSAPSSLTYQWQKNGSNISGATTNSYTISSITSGDAGTYQLVVSNTYQGGIATTTSSSSYGVLTIVGAPSAPQNVALSTAGLSAGQLKLTWDAPSSDGGSSVTGYEYRYSLNAEESWSAWTLVDTRTVTISNLGNQKTYKAQVRAKNAYGTSASATTGAAVSTTGDVATTLGAPTSVTVTNGDATNGGKLNIAFADPTVSSSVNAITSYQYSTDNGASWKTAAVVTGLMTISSVSASSTALANGTSYTVLVRVVNAAGPGTASAGVAGTPSKKPGVPTGVSLALGATDGSMVLTFTAPTDNGGLTLSYEYRYKQNTGSWVDAWTAASSSPVTISGITNGNTYDVQIRARNATASGDAADTVSLNTVKATGPTITVQPTNLNLTTGQTTNTTLSVTATGGAGETLSYQWQKSTDGGTTWTSISGATNSTYQVTSNAIVGDAAKFKVIVTGSKSGASSSVSAKIDAWGPDNSICNAPNYNTFYYGNRFYAGTADTVKEFQLQVPASSNLAAIQAMKIRFYTYNSTTKMFFPTTWAGVNAVDLPATTLGDLSYADYTNRTITFRGTVTLPSAGDYWWVVVNTATTSVPFCNSAQATSFTDSWSLYKEGASWVWFGNFRKSIEYGKFAWSTHPNFKLFSSTTTTTSSADTTSSVVTVTVAAAPTITTSTVPGATKGSSYSTTLAVSGGTSAYTWVLANGSKLPAGLTLSTSGVISGTPTELAATTASSSSSSSSSLKNGDFTSNFVNAPANATTASDGWYRYTTAGGATVINTAGKNMTFSYGSPACTNQSTVTMSEVRQTVKIATPGTVNFKVKVKNDTWNRIGYGYSNPCYDPYQVKLTSSDGASPADTGRRVPTTTTGNYVNDNIDLSITTTAPNAVVTISLFGLDAGYWGGNYGPIFYEASLTTPDSASSNASASATSGSTSFTVEVTDANGIKTTKTLTFNVASDISITTKTVGGANKGASYTQALTASGGSAPLTWALASGTLPTGLSLSSTGTISGTTSNSATSQTVSISVTDANGASVSQSYTLNVLSGVPGAPTSLTLGTIGNATVPLTWTAPTDNGGSAITNYIISYVSGKGKTDDQEEGDDHEEDEDKGSVSVSATGLTFPYSLTGLKNGRTYSITVSAKNANATSATSNAVTAIPAKQAGAPQSLSLILANGGIAIRWKKPSDSGGLKIDSYQVQCRKSTDADTDANWKTLTNRRDQNSEKVYSLLLDSTSTEITVAKGNSYHCRVRTKTTKSGVDYYGAWATTTSPLAFVSVPNAPVISAVDSTTATTKVKVTWAQSTDDGGSTINSYIASVAKKKDSGEDEDEKRSCTVNKPNSGWSAGNQECTISGVPTKGSFTVQVVAVNNAGQSEADTETVRILGKTQSLTYASRTYTKTIGDSDFSIGVTSNSGLKLKYSIDNNDVCTITGKGLIKVKKVGTCRITITQSGKADDDDDDDSNNKSDSDWEPITGTSQYVDVTVNPAAPSVPSWVSVTPGDSQVVAKWNAPKAPNNTVSEYVIEYALASGGGWTTFSYDTSTVVTTLNVTGLTNGTAYKFKLAAKNGTASSSSVEMPGSFTPAAVPSKPTIASATAFPDTSTVLIAWTAPNNNGSAITNFTVTGTASGLSNVTCSTGGSGTSCAVTGVKNKNPYTFSLVAKNAIGTSSTSDTVTVSVAGVSQTITLNQTPASTGWNVGDPDMQIDAGSSSGLPLQYSVVSSAICTVSSGGSVHFVSDGTCKIKINQDGTNSATGNGSATKYSPATEYGPIELVVAPAVPSAPTITSVTNTVDGLVIVWSAPSRGGGTMSYVITGTAAGKSNETCSTSSLTCTIAVASKGTRYGFTAISNNGVDSSTASAVVYGTWQVVPTSPNTSGTSSAASTSDGKAIDVYWTKSTSDGGSAILRYTVSAVNGGTTKTCQIARTDTLDSNGYNCSITGLTPGTTYTVTVIATNSIGNSSTLSIGSITPGKSQSITVSSGTSITKTFGDSDFQISATVNSGQTPTYTASGSGCSVSSSGLVHILAVSSCSIEVSQSGGGASEFLAATPVTVTVTINYAAPTKAVITKAAPASGSVILAWSAPSFNGGGTLSYQAFAKVGSTTVSSCSTSSLTCTISSLTDNTEYTITVVATNSGSLSSTSDEVLVSPYTNARAPMPLTATGGNKSTSHTWQAPSAYDGNLHHYVVYYRVAGSGSGFTAGITTSDTATVSGSISGLANNTRYEFYATAWVESATVLSEGNATAHVFATTFDVPTAPLNVSGSSVYVASGNTSTATISWNAPTGNGGSPITGYTVTATSGATSTTCTSTSATTCNITGLAPGTAYSVTVKATNAVGESVESSAHSLTTVAPASAPTSATASGNSTTGLVTISWTVPASNGGNTITSYVVTAYQAGSATSYTCTVAGAASTSCILSGLPFKTAYTFKVAAVTAAGTGASSDATNEVTLVRSQAITFGSITNQDFNVGSIALTATTDSGLGITYTATPASICAVSGAVLTFVSIGACTVAANAAANDFYTAATEVSNTFNINAITPSAVTLLQVNPGASKLTVSWSQASNLGGSTLKHYVLSWATKTDFSDEQTLTTTNYTNVEITGLEAKTGYIVRVSVVTNDAQDASAWSNKLSATTFGAPAAPTIGTATVTSSGIVTVTWTDVPTNNNGGTPITGYVAEAYSVDGSTLTATGLTCSIGGGIQTCAISGLSGSTFYKFKVTASNAVGSATSEPTTDSVRPGTSQTLSITTVNTSHAANIVKLDGKSTSGLPVLYAVTSQTPTTATSSSWGDGRSVCLVDSSGNLTVDLAGTCVITISQDGTDTGNNGAGTSYLPATDVTMTVTVAADKPSVIASFELVAGNSQITADWTAPEDDGGAPITDYLVTWFVSGGDRTNVPAGSTTAVTPVAGSYGRTLESETTYTKTITGLTNGVTYTVLVQAVNSAGAGPES